jgi:hypothetical protein
MSDDEKLYWGFLTARDNPGKSLGLNPNFLEMPRAEMYLASCMYILRSAYGFVESINRGTATGPDGADLPLYTYAAIEYLNQFDFTSKRVFEFGAGGSTLYWMRRAREVVSVENNQGWCDRLRPQLSPNTQLVFAEGDTFPLSIRQFDGTFDVIVVDGAGYRYDCAAEAVTRLADGGIVILDNSDWHPNTAALLKGSGLLQVDMTGFKPCYSHTSTTSIFFDREFDFPTLATRQPAYGFGAKNLQSTEWDQPVARRPA